MIPAKITNFSLSHRNLCFRAAKYLKNRCQYVVCELERIGESPDVFGFGSTSSTHLIEVKISRSDFLNDKKKYYRKYPEMGIGKFRSYLCMEGLIKDEDLPENWGLLWIDSKGKISEIVKARIQESDHIEELKLITSILRREGIKPQIFSYKKYKNDTSKNLQS